MADEIEKQTQRIGRQVFERLREAELSILDPAWWEEKVLEWTMDHPDLKVQLFRFIDVLPALKRDAITRHLVEYLGHARSDLPAPLRWSMDLTSPRSAVGRLVAAAARANVTRMAKRFIAGSTVGEVIGAIRRLRRQRLAVTIDVLGEAVITEREAEDYLQQYLRLLRETAGPAARFGEDPLIDLDHDGAPLPRVNVSLKLSALTALFDPIDPAGTIRGVAPRLRRILDAALEVGAFVNVDMEHYAYKDLTLRIFKEVLAEDAYRDNPHVGIVLQAYLRDCEKDVAELADWARKRSTQVWVRLVKGAYWDYETVLAEQRGWPVPVWQQKWESDQCFERCTDLLLDRHEVLRPAFGSHNIRSLARAVASARRRGLPERFIEIQALYGMADPVKTAMVGLDQRVRVYTPYGQLIPGMAYLVRRLLENTSNESFVRHHFAEGVTPEDLLRAPAPHQGETMRRPTDVKRDGFVNEPLQDFSKDDVRDAFADAIQAVYAGLPAECPVMIAGEPVETVNKRIESYSPSQTDRLVGTAGSASAEDADRAVAAAAGAFAAWRETPPDDRAEIIERAAGILSDRRNELAAWVCIEAGKPWREADGDIAEAIDFCRYYAGEMRRLAVPQSWPVPGETNVTAYMPRGVTAVISPWNFPVAILCGMTTAALVAGNPVIMKPAEQTPVAGFKLYEILREAGVPDGALHFLSGRGEVAGARLVEHPDVATIAFTGSRAVGHWIARRAAEASTGRAGIKKVIAEMGGKNAMIVDDDCDLDEAVPGVLASAFSYAGQKCSACSRAVVLEGIYEEFLNRAVEAAEVLVVGEAADPATFVGPLIDAESVDRVARYVEIGSRDGRLALRKDLGELAGRGHYAAPAILADIPEDSAVAREEIFGPVLAVMKAADIGEAIRIANGTDYALTGGIYSRSPENIDRVRRELMCGNLYINRKITGAFVGRQPFGGFRHSGMGSKAGGRNYLDQFMVSRTITENTLRRGFAPKIEQK